MHRHQLQRIGTGQRLVFTGFQRSMREESGQVIHLFIRRTFGRHPGRTLIDEHRRGIDQFIQILDAVRAFLLVAVMRFQPAAFDHVADHFRQRQAGGGAAHGFNQFDECSNAGRGLA